MKLQAVASALVAAFVAFPVMSKDPVTAVATRDVSTPVSKEPAYESRSTKSGGHGAHWSYKGVTGPEKWGDMKSEYAACKSGLNQTPINLETSVVAQMPALQFGYEPEELKLVNNGHTVQVEIDPGNFMRVNGQRWQLAQYHFHAPSEHTVKGKAYDMELHLVHKNPRSELAVVGVFIRKGAHNPALDKVFKNLPTEVNKPLEKREVKINPEQLLPREKGYFHYVGSLTTPPCSEGVRWFVLRQPIEASAEQIQKFSALFEGHTARPVLPINTRFVFSSGK